MADQTQTILDILQDLDIQFIPRIMECANILGIKLDLITSVQIVKLEREEELKLVINGQTTDKGEPMDECFDIPETELPGLFSTAICERISLICRQSSELNQA